MKPKFNYKQNIFAIFGDSDVFEGQIDAYDYYTSSYLIFFGDSIGSEWIPEIFVFKTEKEAVSKLQKRRKSYENNND